MASTILTPVTLWKDFDDSLPFDEEIVSEREEDNAIVRELYFYGRQTTLGRVKIFATYFIPKGLDEYPAVMTLFEAGFSPDRKFVDMLLGRGYAVFCVDYSGDTGRERFTVYPRDIDYANYFRAGRALEYAEPTARETSWFEWAAVARYAARWLLEQERVTKAGMIGIRSGGEILWKIAPYVPMLCMITVGAAGWLAYRDMEKFGESEQRIFNEERHRFIAGIDSQSYAPHVKCPVLLLSAINDKKCDYDRVYDTFRQINPEVEKAILFSAHGNGLIGSHSLDDLFLFLEKYLKGRSVYISKPINFSFFEDEDGSLKVKGVYDEGGEPLEFGIFYTEKVTTSKARDWTRVLGRKEDRKDNVCTFPLAVYEKSPKVLVYTFVQYSNGFSVTSNIKEFALKKEYKNSCLKSRVIYSSANGVSGFAGFRRRARSIADCFSDGYNSHVRLETGYGGIPGITAESGLISYRVSEPRYEPPEGAVFRFDAYSAAGSDLKVTFYRDAEEQKGFSVKFRVEAGGKWKSFVVEANMLKSDTGVPLSDFTGVVSVVFDGEGEFLINNVLWL